LCTNVTSSSLLYTANTESDWMMLMLDAIKKKNKRLINTNMNVRTFAEYILSLNRTSLSFRNFVVTDICRQVNYLGHALRTMWFALSLMKLVLASRVANQAGVVQKYARTRVITLDVSRWLQTSFSPHC